MRELLIEIGVEELPAIPFLKELPKIKNKWEAVCCEYGLGADFEFFYTPRRLVFHSRNFKTKQDDKTLEFVGAPKHIALKDGVFSPAALSFAKKCGISESELEFKNIDDKEVLYYQKNEPGRDAKGLLGEMIEKFLLSLNFGKSMRWGRGEFDFIRPIRSFLCLFGGEVVEFEKFGVCAGDGFYPHRSVGYEKISIASAAEYFERLPKCGVLLNQDERREKILAEFAKFEAQNGFLVERDEALLDEVVAITECPKALLGEFNEEFLQIPSEAIITSMKENQRYFPVFKNGALSNKFIVVSNSTSSEDGLIINGNERVLRARLSDAMFFYKSDLAADFSAQKLKNISYLKELGSIYDKQLREAEVAKILATNYADALKNEVGEGFLADTQRAVMLSKADLATQMAYEFTELQGVMGGYYARAKGEAEHIAAAISQQYLPDKDSAPCPDSLFASVVALAIKLDTLLSLFSVGKIPSGNKDPYALRRAANGIIKIVLNLKISFNLDEILVKAAKNYTNFDLSVLKNFILERLYTFFDVNPSIIKACLESQNSDILQLHSAISALSKIASQADFKQNFSTFKRLANISKEKSSAAPDSALFEKPQESQLHEAFLNLKPSEDFEVRLKGLFGLKPQIDAFFEAVMINADDPKIRQNRLNLVGQIYAEFVKIADIKEISV